MLVVVLVYNHPERALLQSPLSKYTPTFSFETTMSSAVMRLDDRLRHCKMDVTACDVSSVVQVWNDWLVKLQDASFALPNRRYKYFFDHWCVLFLRVCASGRSMLLKAVNDGVRFDAYAMGPVSSFHIETCSEYFKVHVNFVYDLTVSHEYVQLSFYSRSSYFVMEEMDRPSAYVRREGVWRVSPMCAFAGNASFHKFPPQMREVQCEVLQSTVNCLMPKFTELDTNVVGKFLTVDNTPARAQEPSSSLTFNPITPASSFARRLAARRAREAVRIQRNQNRAPRAARMRPSSDVSSGSSASAVQLAVCQPIFCKQMFRLTEDHQCSICLQDTTEDTHRVFTCGHFLCSGCMGNTAFDWTCPLCRGEIRRN